MRAPLLASSLALLALAGCSSADEQGPPPPSPAAEAPATPVVDPPPADAPRLEPTACRYIVPKSAEGKAVRCADLSVPENRRVAGSRKIKLHVAIIPGRAEGVPTIELMGGPGGGSDSVVGGLAARDPMFLDAYAKILDRGSVVLFDQRGTGRSQPRLSCSKYYDDADTMARCAKALTAEGIDLAAYDTVENADDVHDLKAALGVPQVNLHGISYGTRLGIEIIKRHPDDVRAAILDGVMPTDVAVIGAFELALDAIFTKVFTTCAADPKCNAAYPTLETALTRLEKKLDSKPLKGDDPRFGPFDLDWRAFVDETLTRLYAGGEEAARLPFRVHDLLTKDQASFDRDLAREKAELEKRREEEDKAAAANPLLAELLERYDTMSDDDFDAMGMAYGMYMSVTCNDYAQHESLASARAMTSKIRPGLVDDRMMEQQFADCSVWPRRPSDATVRTPTTFSGPTLVIGGVLDPATPSVWAERVASALPKEQLVIVPTGGHGAMDACGAGLKSAFLAEPTRALDATCVSQEKLSFYYPDAAKPPFHSAPRASNPTLRPAGSAKTTLERIEQRVLGASTAFNKAVPTATWRAARR